MMQRVVTNSSSTSWPQLSQSSGDKLNQLVQFTTDLRQATAHPEDRIQRGSPRARFLASLMTRKCRDFQQLSINQIFQDDSDFPGMNILQAHFAIFQGTLETPFNDGGNEPGYTERVFYIERLMYDSGLMRGHAEVILEQNSYWRSKIAGIQHQPLARQLNFGSTESRSNQNLSPTPLGRQLPSQLNSSRNPSQPLLSRQLPSRPNSSQNSSQPLLSRQLPSQPNRSRNPSQPLLSRQLPSRPNSSQNSSQPLLSRQLPSQPNSSQNSSQPLLSRQLPSQPNSSQNSSQPLLNRQLQSQSPQQVVRVSAPSFPGTASQGHSYTGPGLFASPTMSYASSNNDSQLRPPDVPTVSPALPSSSAQLTTPSVSPDLATIQAGIQDPHIVSEEPVTVKVDLLSYVHSKIVSLWKEEKHTDVTFVVGEGKKRVLAHRAILACQSNYFESLLFGDMVEAGKEMIALEDVTDPDRFILVVNYAYTGQLEIENGKLQDVLDVLAMADRFGFVQLKEALSEKLASVVTLKNVLHLLLYADLYQASSFLNQCLTTVDRKAEEVLSSDAFLALAHSTLSLIISRDTFFVPEMMIYHSVVCWKDFNGVSKEELEEVLGCVRLSEIPPKDLFVTVEPAQLFKPTEITSALRVQIKPEFQQMKPRGRKASGKNVLECGKFVGNGGNVTYSGSRIRISGPPSILDGVVTLDAPRKITVSKVSHLCSSNSSSEAIQLARLQLGRDLQPATLQLGSDLLPARLQLGSDLQPARLQLGGDLQPASYRRPLGSDLQPARLPLGSDLQPARLPLGRDLQPARLPLGSDLQPARLPLGSDLQPASYRRPLSSDLQPAGLLLGSDLQPARFPLGSDLQLASLPLGSALQPARLPLGSDLQPARLPLGSDLQPARLPLGSDLQPARLPLGSDLQPARLQLGSDLQPARRPLGSDLQPARLLLGSDLQPARRPLGSDLQPARLLLGSDLQPARRPLGSDLQPARLPLGSDLQPARLQLGGDLQPASYRRPLSSDLQPAGLLLGSDLQPARLPLGSDLQPARLPLGSDLQPARLPLGSDLQPARLPLGSALQPARLPLGSDLQPARLPLGSDLQPARLPLGSDLQPARLQLGSDLQPARRPLGSDLQPARLLLGSDLQPARRPLGSDLQPARLPLGSDLQPARLPLGSDLQPARLPLGSDLQPARLQLGSDLQPARRPLGSDLQPARLPLGSDLQPARLPLGSDLQPARLPLGSDLQPARLQLGSDLQPARLQLGGDLQPARLQLGSDLQPAAGLVGGSPQPAGFVVRPQQPPQQPGGLVVRPQQPPQQPGGLVVRPQQPPQQPGGLVVRPQQPPQQPGGLVVRPQQPAGLTLGGGLRLGSGLGGGSQQPGQRGGPLPMFSSAIYSGLLGRKKVVNSQRTISVELNDVYLVNTISFRPFSYSPGSTQVSGTRSTGVSDLLPSTNMNQWCFSYKIRISKSKDNWETLLDFSEMDCYFDQMLQFPTQAVKYIEFELTSCTQQLQLKFVSCSFEDMKPFNFKENGVIAPHYPCSLMGYQVSELPPGMARDTDVVAARTAVINTPHSMSQLSFKILGPDDSLNGDIAVLVSAIWESESFKEVGSLSSKEFGTELCVKFDERVVSYVLVLIKNIQKKDHEPMAATAESFVFIPTAATSTGKTNSSQVKDSPQYLKTVLPATTESQVGGDLITDKEGSSSYRIVDLKCQVSPPNSV